MVAPGADRPSPPPPLATPLYIALQNTDKILVNFWKSEELQF